jgi:AraC family L-rhamnose operon transcriptional activator RhaR
LHSCCFSTDLLSRELAWTREDLQLCYLLTTGPYSVQGCGALVTHLDPDALADCQDHLAAPGELRHSPVSHYRGDIIGRLTLLFSQLGQAVTQTHPALSSRTHPAIIETMRLLEAELAYRWTLTDLAGRLSLAPGYLTRLFKSATGLPPMDYLARQRTEQGAALLLHSDESVTHIGQAVGWPDQSTSARRFKAHYGLSATTYRARFAKRADRLDLWPSAAGEYL